MTTMHGVSAFSFLIDMADRTAAENAAAAAADRAKKYIASDASHQFVWEPHAIACHGEVTVYASLDSAGRVQYAFDDAEQDRIETAAWYGRGEKPDPMRAMAELFVSVAAGYEGMRSKSAAKPALAGLAITAGDTRYQGLGFNSEP